MCLLLFFTLDEGLLARSQYSEGPATGPARHRFFLVSLCLRGLLEKYPTFGREKETGLPGALDN